MWRSAIATIAILPAFGNVAWAAEEADGGRAGRLLGRFQQLDRDGDGVLSSGELPNAPWVSRADRDGDGKVTLNEAKAAFAVGVASETGDGATLEGPGPHGPYSGLSQKHWKVEGVRREALVYAPESAAEADTPVVFAFHGHGGNMRNAARSFRIHSLWPEAIAVYMQGLPTPGMTDPEGKRPGWQKIAGDQQDRDLKFFDAVLADLKKTYRVDAKRIYATGHSNGGGFTYLLWAARGDVFAALAPSAAGGAARNAGGLKPLPVLHLAGEKDTVVPFPLQLQNMELVKKLNGCVAEGKPWASAGPLAGTIYSSPSGTPFVSVIHPGTHAYPKEAPGLIVQFFKENARQ